MKLRIRETAMRLANLYELPVKYEYTNSIETAILNTKYIIQYIKKCPTNFYYYT